jgi:hypothetical protein
VQRPAILDATTPSNGRGVGSADDRLACAGDNAQKEGPWQLNYSEPPSSITDTLLPAEALETQ